MKFFLIKKFFCSGQFWAPSKGGNQRNCSQEKRWKWYSMMLHKKQCLFEIKLFFFTLMNKVRVSFSVFFFFCENLSLKRFFVSKKIPSWKQSKKVVFEIALRILKEKHQFWKCGKLSQNYFGIASCLESLFQKQARKKLLYLWTKSFFGSSTTEGQKLAMKKTRRFYLFFELRKIIVIEAKLDEEQMGTARN